MTIPSQGLAQLKRNEGRRPRPYQDTKGIWTVGYGTNLTTGSLSEAAMTQMLVDRLQDVETACLSLPIWKDLSEPRQWVLLDMGYTMGFAGLMEFTEMYNALKAGDYAGAAAALRDSKWANEVGARADRLTKQMETDTWV
jgi:lysozyme